MDFVWIAATIVLIGPPTLLALAALTGAADRSHCRPIAPLFLVLLVPAAAIGFSLSVLLSLATGLAPRTLMWPLLAIGWLWLSWRWFKGLRGDTDLPPASHDLNPQRLPRWSLFAATVVVPLTAVRATLAPWFPDSQDMWFLKARALAEPGSSWLDFLVNPLFSSTNYPPVGSAIGAAAMMLGGSGDPLAQWATAALTLSLALVLGWVVGRWARTAVEAVLLGIGIPFLCLGLGKGNGFDGYVDMPAAIAVVCFSLVLWLTDKEPIDDLVLVITASCAALTKNESFLFVLAILFLHAVWTWRARRTVERATWLSGISATLGFLWVVLVRLRGAADEPWRWHATLPWSEDWWRRSTSIVEFTLERWPARAAVVFAVSLVLLTMLEHAVATSSRGRADRPSPLRSLRLVPVGLCLAHAVVLGLIVLLIYLATPRDLQWHLRVSISRVVIAVEALLCAAGCFAAASLIPLASSDREEV